MLLWNACYSFCEKKKKIIKRTEIPIYENKSQKPPPQQQQKPDQSTMLTKNKWHEEMHVWLSFKCVCVCAHAHTHMDMCACECTHACRCTCENIASEDITETIIFELYKPSLWPQPWKSHNKCYTTCVTSPVRSWWINTSKCSLSSNKSASIWQSWSVPTRCPRHLRPGHWQSKFSLFIIKATPLGLESIL